ncbi:hypothetical protein Q644_15200 [Brucella intermedia 229E]|uniref:Uncharacterized protein n=1 Tax=Brucella intermedia 229E TaxID=1337887 RepID=U4VIM9_9HYPH|nr:hypothetical protein Q644_15200 [Brucella intermedia 229E]
MWVAIITVVATGLIQEHASTITEAMMLAG